jgi:redox-sensitive bicupin YhaK (pirin superfamily)
MKRVIGIYSAPRQHWVGDGFPVRSLFSYQTHGRALSPFLLLDRAGPAHFEPADHARGVGTPAPCFETVTIVYEGGRPSRLDRPGGSSVRETCSG